MENTNIIHKVMSAMTDAVNLGDLVAVTASARQLEDIIHANPLVCEICGADAGSGNIWAANGRLVCDECLYMRRIDCEQAETNPIDIAFSELETIIVEIEDEEVLDRDLIKSRIETIQYHLKQGGICNG